MLTETFRFPHHFLLATATCDSLTVYCLALHVFHASLAHKSQLSVGTAKKTVPDNIVFAQHGH